MKQVMLKILVFALLLFCLEGCGGKEGETAKQTAAEALEEPMEEYAVEESAEAEMAEGMPPPSDDDPSSPRNPQANTEEYDRIYENPFLAASQNPLSTFSIDVDNAAYSNVRRFINQGQLPPAGAVRIEEMVNYFNYDYPNPTGQQPFSVSTEIGECPWDKRHQLIHIGLQGKKLNYQDLKNCNLVFLVDASGSMEDENKLPLLKKSLGLLLNELSDNDRIAIVAYAGAAGLVLPSTPASQKRTILNALSKLEAGGSTAGGEGIALAYKIAQENLIKGGNNRVILATDGDFNVGPSSSDELVRMIEEKRKQDIYLTICGFGMGNYKDSQMEQISNAGNGNYFYIDNILEAKKVFVKEMRANLFTIAKDVKIQIEFNPQQVKAYRLIGYENRALRNEDFDDDTKDAGELGAGHSVTAIYEIIPASSSEEVATTKLKYQNTTPTANFNANEVMTLKLRYKPIDSNSSLLISQAVTAQSKSFAQCSENYRFSAAVAGFGLLLRNSQYKGELTYEQVIRMAQGAKGKDQEGYRAEMLRLLESAAALSQNL